MAHNLGEPAQPSLFPEAAPPRSPAAADFTSAWTENAARNTTAHEAQDRAARALEHRRILRGLTLLATATLLLTLAHAALNHRLYPGWWKQW